MAYSKVFKSVSKVKDIMEFKLTVGNEKLLYISTISDLGEDMLVLDFPTGEYGLHPFFAGYVLKMKDYSVEIDDAKRVFTTAEGDKGLIDTFYGRHSTNVDQLRLFNKYISEHMANDEVWWRNFSKHSYRNKLQVLELFNNIPVLFYLTEKINLEDLRKITLTSASKIKNCGNIDACWFVTHSKKGNIGIAVKQEEFHIMMGKFAGVCLLASNGHRAIGNFDCEGITPEDPMRLDWAFYPEHRYKCEFADCRCDTSNKMRKAQKKADKKSKFNEPCCSTDYEY